MAKPDEQRGSLRARATELGRTKPGYKSRIDILLDALSEDDRAEVLDLLQGEPLLPHSAVAKVLLDAYPDLASDPIIRERNVMDWRRARGLRLRTAYDGM